DVETASIDPERGSSNPLIVDHLADLLGPDLDQPWASNVWVVGPERTGTGAPILANDPHLGLSVPIPWYLVRLESPKLAIRGASVPGVPFIALGHNRSIAWGLTNTGADVQDLLIANIDPEDPQTIVTDEGRVAITVLEEVISVKGEDDQTLEVRSTPFGPVISDVLPDSQRGDEDAVLILAFTALTNEDPTAASLYAINHARDWSDMQQALADWSVPPVNVGYADIDGRFAFAVAGKIPIREAGEGVAPRPLSLRLGAWREFIAAQDLPAIVDPAEGWIGNANNDPAPPDYPYWLAASFEEGFRMARLDSLIEGEAAHTVDKSLDIQTDTVSLAALELLPLMMAMNPQNPAEADLFADLRAWDGSMERDRSEPLVFAYWARELTLALFEDDLAEAMPAYMSFRPTVLSRVLTDHQGWCDDVQTDAMETCLDMLRLSLRRALLLIEADHGTNRANWRWGSEHVASLKHPLFSRIPLIRWFGDASRQTDGGPFTLNRGDTPFRNNEQPFAHTHGAGYRGVFDLADLDKSRFIITTGPSGNPLSPFYDSMVDRWRDGETVSLAGSPDNLAQTGLGVLTLRPMP
ncbi:MAG: penicillin acylase family protein, partial [Pseudomonadota bacterium]